MKSCDGSGGSRPIRRASRRGVPRRWWRSGGRAGLYPLLLLSPCRHEIWSGAGDASCLVVGRPVRNCQSSPRTLEPRGIRRGTTTCSRSRKRSQRSEQKPGGSKHALPSPTNGGNSKPALRQPLRRPAAAMQNPQREIPVVVLDVLGSGRHRTAWCVLGNHLVSVNGERCLLPSPERRSIAAPWSPKSPGAGRRCVKLGSGFPGEASTARREARVSRPVYYGVDFRSTVWTNSGRKPRSSGLPRTPETNRSTLPR
jgi:hypothetical protein